MRKNQILCAVMLCFLCLLGCASKKSVEGEYKISNFVYEGYSMPLDGGYEKSSVSISKMNNNLDCTTFLYIGSDMSLMSGYLDEDLKTDELITYKYWITSTSGGVSAGNGSWVYLYYYPKKDEIKLKAAGSLDLTFKKAK